MLLHGGGQCIRALADRAVDRHGGTQDQFVEQPQTFRKRIVEGLGPLDQLHVERLRAVGERRIERPGILLEHGLQRLRAAANGAVDLLHVAGEQLLHLIAAMAERAAERASVGLDHGLQLAAAGTEHRLQLRRAAADHLLQLLGAVAQRRLELAGLVRDRRLELGQVLAGALDDAGKLDLLVRERLDQARHLGAHRAQRLGDAIAGRQQGIALARELLDQRADLALVLLVRPLERGDLVVDQRLELAGAAERPRHRVVHERHLPPHRLAERGNRLLCHPIRFGEPHRDLGHRRRAQFELLGAPGEKCQEPEQRDRPQQGRGAGQKARSGYEIAEALAAEQVWADQHPGESEADGDPDATCHAGIEERLVRRLLVERIDEAADRRRVVVGGNSAARWSGGAAACLTASALVLAGGGILRGRRRSSGLGRDRSRLRCWRRACRWRAMARRQWRRSARRHAHGTWRVPRCVSRRRRRTNGFPLLRHSAAWPDPVPLQPAHRIVTPNQYTSRAGGET